MRYFYRHGVDMPIPEFIEAVRAGAKYFHENEYSPGAPSKPVHRARGMDLDGELITVFATDAQAVELAHRGFMPDNWICGYDSHNSIPRGNSRLGGRRMPDIVRRPRELKK